MLLIGSPARSQFILPCLFSITIEMIQPQRCGTRISLLYFFCKKNFLFQLCTAGFILFLRSFPGNKGCLPFLFLQNSCHEGCCRPLAFFPLPVCFRCLPVLCFHSGACFCYILGLCFHSDACFRYIPALCLYLYLYYIFCAGFQKFFHRQPDRHRFFTLHPAAFIKPALFSFCCQS